MLFIEKTQYSKQNAVRNPLIEENLWITADRDKFNKDPLGSLFR